MTNGGKLKNDYKEKMPNRQKEYVVTLALFCTLLTVILIAFFSVSFVTKLSAKKRDIDSVSENMVASYNRYIEEVNKVSKQTFISEDLMEIQDEYLKDFNNDNIYAYIVRQFENYNSSLVVGMGYIPYSEEYRCGDIVYSGTKTLSFNYMTESSRTLVDSIVEKSNDEMYNSGRMYLIYNDRWDMHIFARVVKDIRIDHFDTVGGLGFLIVNSSVFRQQKKYGEVVKGFSSFVLYDGQPILNEEIPTDLVSDKSYYVHKTSFSQYCEYYGFFKESAVLQDMLLDSIVMLTTFVLVLILFIVVYKRNHDKNTRSFEYLIENFQKVGMQTEITSIEPTKDDSDVNQVISTYNNMVENILCEREKNEKLQDENRKIELQGLYQQINKHFIINVLSAVHSLIQLDKRDKANECVENLADFLRYTLSINISETSLEDEINSSISYVNLQRMRFPNVEFTCEVDGDIKDCTVPKFIIQPLIENAYVHGIKNKIGFIKLKVSVQNDKLYIVVANNSSKVNQSDIDKVNASIMNDSEKEEYTDSGHGIALKNIRKRLQLKHSDAKVFLSVTDDTTCANIVVNIAK